MFKLYCFMIDDDLLLLGKFEKLTDAESAATNFDYIRYKITSDDREGCLIGFRHPVDIDDEHTFIQWRVDPSIRKGGAKRL